MHVGLSAVSDCVMVRKVKVEVSLGLKTAKKRGRQAVM